MIVMDVRKNYLNMQHNLSNLYNILAACTWGEKKSLNIWILLRKKEAIYPVLILFLQYFCAFSAY